MNIVVLAGGLSTERDVSLTTGTMVSRALRENGHNVLMLDVYLGYGDEETDITDIFFHTTDAGETASTIRAKAPDLAHIKALRKDGGACFFGPNVLAICQAADFVFLALHGENGENGKVQAVFDLFGIRYSGAGYLSSAMAMDKGLSKQLFASAGIPTPAGLSMKKSAPLSLAEANVALPCVVKPCCGGSSIGVSIVRTEEEYAAALEEAFSYEEEVVVESYICGREFSVGVLGFEALPVIEIAPVEGFYDYQNKYKAGSAVETCPANLPEDISKRMQDIAVQVCRVLGISSYARMDFLLNEEGELFCLEANTLPGMTPTSLLPQEAAAVGISFPALCEKLIALSL